MKHYHWALEKESSSKEDRSGNDEFNHEGFDEVDDQD